MFALCVGFKVAGGFSCIFVKFSRPKAKRRPRLKEESLIIHNFVSISFLAVIAYIFFFFGKLSFSLFLSFSSRLERHDRRPRRVGELCSNYARTLLFDVTIQVQQSSENCTYVRTSHDQSFARLRKKMSTCTRNSLVYVVRRWNY